MSGLPASAFALPAVIAISFYLLYVFLRRKLVKYIWDQGTVLRELFNSGQCRQEHDKIKGTVVIAGGSLAGLMAARVCADHFEKILVVDPEPCLSEDAAGEGLKTFNTDAVSTDKKRSRIPQYDATHGQLLAYGVYSAGHSD